MSLNSNTPIDWGTEPAPKSGEEMITRLTLTSNLYNRKPLRQEAIIDFGYLEMLPECKGISEEKLIAVGPSILHFTNEEKNATAFLTDKRLVHLSQHKGLNAAIGSRHELLAGIRTEGSFDITINWYDQRCPVVGVSPKLVKNGLENRYALEWWYSFASIANLHFARKK